MKLTFLIITTLSFSLLLFSIPSTISYQGILSDSNGNPVSNSIYTATFSLYDDESAGELEWQEEQSFITNDGIFNIKLGSIEPFGNLNFDESLWLEIHLEGEANPLTDRIPLSSTPFSISSKNLFGGEIQNTIIGNKTASSATFTDLTVSGSNFSANSSTLSLSSLSLASTTMYIPNSISNGAVLTSDGEGNATWQDLSSGVSLSNDEEIIGNWSNTQNPWTDNEISDNITISNGTINNSEIGSISPAGATFTSLETSTITITEGAEDGYVLTSDANGKASWEQVSGSSTPSSSSTYYIVLQLNIPDYTATSSAFIGASTLWPSINSPDFLFPMVNSGTVTTVYMATASAAGSSTLEIYKDNGSTLIDSDNLIMSNADEMYKFNFDNGGFSADDVLNFRYDPTTRPDHVTALVYIKLNQ